MEREAIKKAYDAYLLDREAKKYLKPKLLEEKHVLEILRILEESYPNDEGFSVSAILYVLMKVFAEGHSETHCHNIMCSKLWDALSEGKVIYTNKRKWKLAPEKETQKTQTGLSEKPGKLLMNVV